MRMLLQCLSNQKSNVFLLYILSYNTNVKTVKSSSGFLNQIRFLFYFFDNLCFTGGPDEVSHVGVELFLLGIWCSALRRCSGLNMALTPRRLISCGGLTHSKQVKSAFLNCLLLDLRRELFILHLCYELN